ncbi:MAG: sigma-54-dependent transcriptional regulator [Holosporales bacterium]
MSNEILIVDDEADIGRLISETLQDEGYSTRHALDGPSALEAIRDRCPSLIILDIWLGDSRFDGMKVLEEVQRDFPHVPVLMMSGHGTIETAVNAIKLGAYDFIEKPFKTDRLLVLVGRAIEAARLRREVEELKLKAVQTQELIGKSSALQQVRQMVEKVASTSSRVLIVGPSGAGKEVVARMICAKSKRANAPFVILSCARLAPDQVEAELFGCDGLEGERRIGVLEKAHGGTLLLDEIADLPLETQGKLVRVLQDQSFQRLGSNRRVQVDVRVIASTSRDLQFLIEEGYFREDLYYRLSVVPIRLPALRERREDIPELVEYFIKRTADAHGLAPKPFAEETLLALQAYEWPGNVRQLRNVVEWILIMTANDECDAVRPDHLPGDIFGETPALLRNEHGAHVMRLPLRDAREQFEKDYLLAQVARFAGNISQTASFVGMERSALHRKLKNLRIDRGSR